MSEGIVPKPTGTYEVSTGISGVTAWMSGNMCTLAISSGTISTDTEGWMRLGYLPDGIRPKNNIRFCTYDNLGTTQGASTILQGLVQPNGSLSIYLYNDKKSAQPQGEVVYPV